MRNALSLVTIALVALLAASCSDDDNPAAPREPAAPTYDHYVNVATGDDSNPGTAGEPWATITYALATAEAGKRIGVAPGTYSAASGESFPMRMKRGQHLIGDMSEKGAGATPTRIQGEGAYKLWLLDGATIVGAKGARIAGFTVVGETGQHNYACIAVNGAAMEIDHNTFPVGTYAGINSANGAGPDIHDNVFRTVTYGCFMDGSTNAHVYDNDFDGNTGIRIFGSTDCVFEKNTFLSLHTAIHAGSGTLTIRNNEFSARSTTYTSGAIVNDSGSPVIRSNTFADGPALLLKDTGAANAGAVASPGNNDFSAISGVVVRHGSSETAYAVGNDWPNTPPQVGTDIIITGAGSVVTH